MRGIGIICLRYPLVLLITHRSPRLHSAFPCTLLSMRYLWLILLEYFYIHCMFIGKNSCPHRIDKTLDKSLYRGCNPHLMNRFLRMSWASNFIMVSEPVDFKGHLPIHAPIPKSATGRDDHSRTKAQRMLGVTGVYWEEKKNMSHIG
ncbi:hypothetical protein MtrunA17_Chr4g0019591 [Medicago truncatula]|uniref:Uncharacterized protein n=1 Tax=Medicago truncatula TaxID=3880 RepID=A0A396I8F6_MEDTR|nr:hypothetical protein MtrunA17_Chr4g0019591 [Medicago truncatula]